MRIKQCTLLQAMRAGFILWFTALKLIFEKVSLSSDIWRGLGSWKTDIHIAGHGRSQIRNIFQFIEEMNCSWLVLSWDEDIH